MKHHTSGTVIPVKTAGDGYNIYIAKYALNNIEDFICVSPNRKTLIVTDSGVPADYAKTVASRVFENVILTIPQGEASKSMETLALILRTMVENDFTRNDCVVAVGGGVVGDLSGFAASMYMRGIDFYNVPTTVLSQVDSSVGGKTAIDFMGFKNIVGAFYPPKAVVIDTDVLKTLPQRQISNGLAEALKMSLTHDKELFEIFEKGDINSNIELIIERALTIKKSVVEADEKESGLRRVLNFGHTLAHGIESANGMEKYYHGECVAIGMLPMCTPEVRERLIPILQKLGLPHEFSGNDLDSVLTACKHDKKMSGRDITVVYVPNVGEFEFKKMPFTEYEKMIRQALES